jgi:non-specific serine/threonine protein kinase
VHDIAAVEEYLTRADIRLLTLIGPPGIGKTRLAIEALNELRGAAAGGSEVAFVDGSAFVALAPVRNPALVLGAIARALGIDERPGRPLQERLQIFLRDKRMLLTLDNFEHVLPAAPQLGQLLATAPGLTLLVTSRVALRLAGEQRFTVPALELPPLPGEARQALNALPASSSIQYPSVELFVQRARAIAPAFALTETNARAVAEICRRLDGLPLAIELAAARVAVFTPEELLARLDRRFALLTSGAVDQPIRQQTLRGALDWSYELLEAGERRLFRWLGIFVGGWTLEAAESVCVSPGSQPDLSVADGLAALLDKSLLRREDRSDGGPRFTMLETIREYARERLEQAGEFEAAQTLRLRYCLALAESAAPRSAAGEQLWLERVAQEHDNLQAALEWAIERDIADALHLAAALADFWHVRGYLSEGRQWLERVLLAADAHAESMPAASSVAAAHAKALHGAAMLAHSQEDDVRAEALFSASLALAQASGDRRRVASLLNDLGELALHRGDAQRALGLHQEGLALARAIGDERTTAQLLTGLGVALRTAGDLAAAQSRLEESIALHQRLADQRGAAWALHALGLTVQAMGDYSHALELFTQALELARSVSDRENIAWLFYALGNILLKSHDLTGAMAHFGQGARLSHALGLRQGTALNLDGLAAVYIQQGQLAQAARLLSAADAQWRQANSSYSAADDRAEHQRAVAAVRAQLDGEAFGAAWEEGQA